jgi:WD40 repeat protein
VTLCIRSADAAQCRIWSLKTYELLHTFTGHNKGIRSLALSPKGVLVSVGQDKAINGESRCRARPHDD